MAGKATALTVRKVQVAVVGGGPAGLTAAIALAASGIEVALIARTAAVDHRTTALLAGSVTALERWRLGVCRDNPRRCG
jgi:2-octaprenyl-6-methoxyphenol hydroxylase